MMKKLLVILTLAVVTAIGTAGTAGIEICSCTFQIIDGNGNNVDDAILIVNGVVSAAMNGTVTLSFEKGIEVTAVAYKEGYDTASIVFVIVKNTEKTIVLNQSDTDV